MDSDSNVQLSNLAGTDYLRREIVKFERLVAEKTAPGSAVGAVTDRRRSVTLRAAGTVDSPVNAATAW